MGAGAGALKGIEERRYTETCAESCAFVSAPRDRERSPYSGVLLCLV